MMLQTKPSSKGVFFRLHGHRFLMLLLFVAGFSTASIVRADRLEAPDQTGRVFTTNTAWNPVYSNTLNTQKLFSNFSANRLKTQLTQVSSLKVTIDLRDKKVYYANANLYPLHYYFAAEQLGYDLGIPRFNETQYLSHPDRTFLLAELNYYKEQDLFTMYLSPSTEMSCAEISWVLAQIEATSFLAGKLVYQIGNETRDVCDLPRVITNAELYKGQEYQALNTETAYGYLRFAEVSELENIQTDRRDILVLRGIPNDVSVVSGIITTEFQTLLSHVNVLSSNRGTPNMALRGAWSNSNLRALENKLVKLEVGANTYSIEAASFDEAEAFWRLKDPRDPVYLAKNTQTQGLIELDQASYALVHTIGGKAANFAELLLADATTPEDYFAIPFYYYDQHMRQNGLDKVLDDLLADPLLKQDPSKRKAALKALRKKIRSAPVDTQLVNMVQDRLYNFAYFPSYRFRSSTNAEDLAEFSGAGLYDSTSAKRDHKKKTVERAVKKVWASLWNWRAYEERSYYKIDHKSVAMGILVNRSFPDEDANGVLLTINPYSSNPAFIINVAHKEYSIVQPEDGYSSDQILLHTWSIQPGEDFEIEYLARSDRPGYVGTPAMTDAEIVELGRQAMRVKRRYYTLIPHDGTKQFLDFGLEMEFKVDSSVSPRKVYIKQVRPYN